MRFGRMLTLAFEWYRRGLQPFNPGCLCFHQTANRFSKVFPAGLQLGWPDQLICCTPGLKLVHPFPTAFVIGMIALLVFSLFCYCLIFIPLCIAFFVCSCPFESGSMQVAGLSILLPGFNFWIWVGFCMHLEKAGDEGRVLYSKNFYK